VSAVLVASGSALIEIARGFGMNVIAYDLHPDEAAAFRLGFTYRSLDHLLSDSDVLTLHVPATSGTHRMISDREFSRMKQGAILINRLAAVSLTSGRWCGRWLMGGFAPPASMSCRRSP
jgi:S-adenosylhomocysteine hydrolase